jgi:hypothetical protein
MLDRVVPTLTPLSYDKIWIIQWLRNDDRETGKELHDALNRVTNDLIPIVFNEVFSRKDLIDVLNEVLIDVTTNKTVPILHIETHGNDDFIGTDFDDDMHKMSHLDLLGSFRKINIETQFNLFIVVAACFGVKLGNIIMGTLLQPSPFWGLLGPVRKTTPDAIFQGFFAFYKCLLSRQSISNALSSLFIVEPSLNYNISMISAESLFVKGLKNYFDYQCSNEVAEERARKKVSQSLSKKGIYTIDEDMVCKMIKRLQSTAYKREIYEKRKRVFFMHDLFPENNELPNPEYPA